MNTSIIDPLQLPSLSLLERRSLPNCPAIYFALLGKRVLYIGRSVNLAQRWLSHHRWNQLTRMYPTARIAWIECSDSELLPQIEAALIEQFNPELNREPIEAVSSKTLSVIVSEEIQKKLERLAKSKLWSVSQTARVLIERGLEQAEAEAEAEAESKKD